MRQRVRSLLHGTSTDANDENSADDSSDAKEISESKAYKEEDAKPDKSEQKSGGKARKERPAWALTEEKAQVRRQTYPYIGRLIL